MRKCVVCLVLTKVVWEGKKRRWKERLNLSGKRKDDYVIGVSLDVSVKFCINLWFRSIHEFRERRNKTGKEQFSLPFGKIENKLFDETLIRFSSPNRHRCRLWSSTRWKFSVSTSIISSLSHNACVHVRVFYIVHLCYFSRALENDLFCHGEKIMKYRRRQHMNQTLKYSLMTHFCSSSTITT